jgi:hypothetical protein
VCIVDNSGVFVFCCQKNLRDRTGKAIVISEEKVTTLRNNTTNNLSRSNVFINLFSNPFFCYENIEISLTAGSYNTTQGQRWAMRCIRHGFSSFEIFILS